MVAADEPVQLRHGLGIAGNVGPRGFGGGDEEPFEGDGIVLDLCAAPNGAFGRRPKSTTQLNPPASRRRLTLQRRLGAVHGSGLASIPNFKDFGWGVSRKRPWTRISTTPTGSSAYPLFDPSGWYRTIPAYGPSQPPYSVLVSALTSDAATGTGTTLEGAPVKSGAGGDQFLALQRGGQYQVNGQVLLLVRGPACRSIRCFRIRTSPLRAWWSILKK